MHAKASKQAIEGETTSVYTFCRFTVVCMANCSIAVLQHMLKLMLTMGCLTPRLQPAWYCRYCNRCTYQLSCKTRNNDPDCAYLGSACLVSYQWPTSQYNRCSQPALNYQVRSRMPRYPPGLTPTVYTLHRRAIICAHAPSSTTQRRPHRVPALGSWVHQSTRSSKITDHHDIIPVIWAARRAWRPERPPTHRAERPDRHARATRPRPPPAAQTPGAEAAAGSSRQHQNTISA